jgi:uncharacterized linocin/CFP29 family protein
MGILDLRNIDRFCRSASGLFAFKNYLKLSKIEDPKTKCNLVISKVSEPSAGGRGGPKFVVVESQYFSKEVMQNLKS